MFCDHAKSLLKAVTWRLLGAADTFALSFFLTGKLALASSLVGAEVFTKTALFYAHERAWKWSLA